MHRLVYYEGAASVEAAKCRERQLKGWLRVKKLRLIESINPEWEDLFWGLK